MLILVISFLILGGTGKTKYSDYFEDLPHAQAEVTHLGEGPMLLLEVLTVAAEGLLPSSKQLKHLPDRLPSFRII